MPLYEYRCDACGGVFEVIEKFSDEPLKTHAGCGGKVERQVSTSVLQFKGSGWYVNDYAKGNGSQSLKPAKAATSVKTEPAAPKPVPSGQSDRK
jgi:putative FmdB family regulatory protein